MLVSVNMWENARAGMGGLVEVSVRERESKRTKYSVPLGPIVGSGMNERKRGDETLMLAEMVWRLVC